MTRGVSLLLDSFFFFFENSCCYWNKIRLWRYKAGSKQKHEGETQKCCFCFIYHVSLYLGCLLGCSLRESSHHTNSGHPRPCVSLNHFESNAWCWCAAFKLRTVCAHHTDSASAFVSALMLTEVPTEEMQRGSVLVLKHISTMTPTDLFLLRRNRRGRRRARCWTFSSFFSFLLLSRK